MKAAKKQKYGYGAYASEKYRYTTIEQNVSAIRKFYDDALKDTRIANPARNARVEKVRVASRERATGCEAVRTAERRWRVRGGGSCAAAASACALVRCGRRRARRRGHGRERARRAGWVCDAARGLAAFERRVRLPYAAGAQDDGKGC